MSTSVYSREKYLAHKAEGKCGCGRPRVPGKSLCQPCRESQQRYRNGGKTNRNLRFSSGRLRRIAEIIEEIDERCLAADGDVTPTHLEMTDDELREIYRLARGRSWCPCP